jgi:hypothetical protein
MAFGQQLGPPASAKQVQELLTLLKAAGHSDFRDARGPMGFTQRQAGGRFGRDEAAEFIARLEEAQSASDPASDPDLESPPPAPIPSLRQPTRTPRPVRAEPVGRSIAEVPAGLLADELRRRGWTVVEPG